MATVIKQAPKGPAERPTQLDLAGDKAKLQDEIQKLAAEKRKTQLDPSSLYVLDNLDRIRVRQIDKAKTTGGNSIGIFHINGYGLDEKTFGENVHMGLIGQGRIITLCQTSTEKPPEETEATLKNKLELIKELR